jgi:alkanesulfonate monooxygenase SsuD/methylene tetrahydromethanopterin reductase-like flavin-dependent oxidoreductase (luciferase family)
MGPRTFDAIARCADGWMPITGRSSIRDRIAPLREAFVRHGRDPGGIEVVIAGATTDPRGLANLESEGVQRALLTVWSEDRDQILRTLDDYAVTVRQVRGG